MQNNILRKITLISAITITVVFISMYGTRHTTFYGDALGYYLYLPSIFIYDNLETPDQLPANTGINDGVLWYLNRLKDYKTPNGSHLDQYTYGVALMESPFFFMAHAYEKVRKRKANGYTDTYDYLVKASSLFYAIIGLILVYRILKKYFTSTLSLIGTLCIFLCTNLFWFSVYQAGMSHAILFFLYALLMFLTVKIHDQPTTFSFLATGITVGLITLIRPTDVLCLLIPLLYRVYNVETLRKKIIFINEYRLKIALAAIAFILPLIPQLIYWKILTGSYVYYSYGNQSFDWLHPRIKEGLFYFSNGWFPYSPIMGFAVTGLFFYKQIRNWVWCLWIIIPVYVYIIYSWYCYNYINGLGSRPMIHLYPLLAIPLTAFIQFILRQKLLIKSLFFTILFFFLTLNISYSIQELSGILDSAESNMAYNYQILFRDKLRYKDLVTRDLAERQPDTSKLKLLGTLVCKNYDDSLSIRFVRNTAAGSKYVYHILTEEYVQIDSVVYNKQKFMNAKWFKCGGKFMYSQCPDYDKHKLVLQIKNKLWKLCNIENKIYDWNKYPEQETISLDHCETNKWGYVYFYTKVPKNLENGDVIKIYLWNSGKKEMYMNDICLELYK